jgi:hypothetical protein
VKTIELELDEAVVEERFTEEHDEATVFVEFHELMQDESTAREQFDNVSTRVQPWWSCRAKGTNREGQSSICVSQRLGKVFETFDILGRYSKIDA